MTVTTEQTPGWPWPTPANFTRDVERYFQLLQRQGDVNRQLAISWVAAVVPTSASSAAKPRAPGIPRVATRDRAEPALAGQDKTADPAGQESTKRLVELNARRNELFDSLFDGLIDADILATTR